MHVKRRIGDRLESLDVIWPDGEVGDKMPVHDIDVNPIGAACADLLDIAAQLHEIRAQDRRRDKRCGHRNHLL